MQKIEVHLRREELAALRRAAKRCEPQRCGPDPGRHQKSGGQADIRWAGRHLGRRADAPIDRPRPYLRPALMRRRKGGRHAALATSPGWTARAPMDSLFHALIMAIAIDRSASSLSEKCFRASS